MNKLFNKAILALAFLLTGCTDVCQVTAVLKPEAVTLEAQLTNALLEPRLIPTFCDGFSRSNDGWSAKLSLAQRGLLERLPFHLFNIHLADRESEVLAQILSELQGDLRSACNGNTLGKISDALYYLSQAKQLFSVVDRNIITIETVAFCSSPRGDPERRGD